MTSSFDDTQPRSIFPPVGPPDLQPPDEGDEEQSGPGCLLWGLVGLFGVFIAGAVILLSGLTGWNDGLRVARLNATATRAVDVQVQCSQIQNDIDNTNLGLMQRRFDYLLLQTPVPECIALYAPTATALFFASQPTATPTPEPTPEASLPPPVDITLEPAAAAESGFNLDALLQEARSEIALAQWKEAIETLDAIIAIDASYQKNTVESLLFESLTRRATALYRAGTLAEAILLTDRAENFGDVGELNYERFIASLYLDAQRFLNLNYPEAIRLLRRIVYEQGLPNYQNASTLLFNQYVAYGDALKPSDPCAAVPQYSRALEMRNSVEVVAKQDAANTACQESLLTPVITPGQEGTPGVLPTSTPGVLPPGQVAPPGG